MPQEYLTRISRSDVFFPSCIRDIFKEYIQEYIMGKVFPMINAEYSLFNRALLQKRPIILKSLLTGKTSREHHGVMYSSHHVFLDVYSKNTSKHTSWETHDVFLDVFFEYTSKNTSWEIHPSMHYVFFFLSCNLDVFKEYIQEYIMGKVFPMKNAEYRLFYRALLQKRPIILRSLLTGKNVFFPHSPTHM